LEEFKRFSPNLRLINLETSVTRSDEYWQEKEIHYRMNPENIGCLRAAKVDYCSLANNHILDWGFSGLKETRETLKKVGIEVSGGGENVDEAVSPAILETKGNGRVLTYSFGSLTSGVPYEWAASETRAGVNLLEKSSFNSIKNRIASEKRAGDIVIISVHWGANWGYDIAFEQQNLAQRLIRDAGVDVVWGHSSHHVKSIEVYEGKLILYGCGDFLNDYEGIGGFEGFRGDLSLMFFADIAVTNGRLVALHMVPMRLKQLKLNYASKADAEWMEKTLNREGKKFGTAVRQASRGLLTLIFPAEGC
jgi:poly-gamma-glutamate synthesis protein (capsule biosynthesis protein)